MSINNDKPLASSVPMKRTLGQSLQHELREMRESLTKGSRRRMAGKEPISRKLVAKQEERRRRARRNPVWSYFRVENGLAYCEQCPYKTKSVYSTNLKVHLKSHHRQSYIEVSLPLQKARIQHLSIGNRGGAACRNGRS